MSSGVRLERVYDLGVVGGLRGAPSSGTTPPGGNLRRWAATSAIDRRDPTSASGSRAPARQYLLGLAWEPTA